MQNKRALALSAGLTAAAIWGGMYVVSKIVLDVIPPFALLSLRLILGFISLGIFIAAGGGFKLSKKEWFQALGIGFIGYGVSLGLQFLGTKLSSAANGALVTTATPALVFPLAFLIRKEKIYLKGLFALILASLGVLFVLNLKDADFSSQVFLGNLCLLGAAITWALYSVLSASIEEPSKLLSKSAAFFLGGLPLTLSLGFWEIQSEGLGTLTWGIFAGVLFLGIISTALAMFLWNYAFANLPAQQASLTFFAQPVVGVFLGWFLLKENLSPGFFWGGLFIGTALILASWTPKNKKKFSE